MTDLIAIAEANALPLIVALVIGVAIGWWIWARASAKPERERWQQTEAQANVWAAKEAEADVPVAPIDVPLAAGEADDLTRIKGLGPKLVTLLGGLGITRYDQIAAWTPEQLAAVDAQLGTFKGRPERDNWVEQAALLANGDMAGFEAKFGKIGGP